MNTNDLPPAAKLAALIEAGRAANPDLKHGKLHILSPLGTACALGFACLGSGAARAKVRAFDTDDAFRFLQLPLTDSEHVGDAIWKLNDEGASLDEIILSLREGELAELPA